MTKAGADGASGSMKMKKAGPSIIAQDENSSVVFDMSKEAIKTGAVARIVPISRILQEIIPLNNRSGTDRHSAG